MSEFGMPPWGNARVRWQSRYSPFSSHGAFARSVIMGVSRTSGRGRIFGKTGASGYGSVIYGPHLLQPQAVHICGLLLFHSVLPGDRTPFIGRLFQSVAGLLLPADRVMHGLVECRKILGSARQAKR